MNDWTIRNTETGKEWYADSRSEAEGRIEDMSGYVDPEDFEIIPPGKGDDDADDQEPDPEATQPDPAPEPGDSESTPDREDTTPAPERDETDDGTETVEPEVVDQTTDDDDEQPDDDQPDEIAVEDVSEESEAPQQAQQEAPQPADSYDLPERNVGDDPLEWVPGDFVDDIDGTQAINRKGFEVLSHFYDISVRSEVVVAPEDTDFEYARCKAVATDPNGRECEAHGTAHIDRGDDKVLLLEMADTRARKRALSIATGVGAVAVAELKNEVGA